MRKMKMMVAPIPFDAPRTEVLLRDVYPSRNGREMVYLYSSHFSHISFKSPIQIKTPIYLEKLKNDFIKRFKNANKKTDFSFPSHRRLHGGRWNKLSRKHGRWEKV